MLAAVMKSLHEPLSVEDVPMPEPGPGQVQVEIRASGRVWGNVTTLAFATEEGAFLRGQTQMEEELDLQLDQPAERPEETAPEEKESTAAADEGEQAEEAEA